MNPTPSVIVLDVNETLSDMSPMAIRFTDVGAPGWVARVWFAALLRDGFALAASGGSAQFAQIGEDVLRDILRDIHLSRGIDDAVLHIMEGLTRLSLHHDVPDGVRMLRNEEYRLVTLSNGSSDVARTLLGTADLLADFDALLSVEDAPAWKPARSSYEYAAEACGVHPSEMLLVAVHPWDIHGAAQAGLRTAWVNRTAAVYPGYFAAPDYRIPSLRDLVGCLNA